MERYQEAMVAYSESVMKKMRAAPPGGGLPMTTYPVGNKISLSRKPCIPYTKLLFHEHFHVRLCSQWRTLPHVVA